MKKLFSWIVVALVIVSCESETKEQNFVSLKGNVQSSSIDSFKTVSRGYEKTIYIDENGAFDDTLHVKPGFYAFLNGKNDGHNVFLRNGYKLEVTFKGEKLADGLSFAGVGSETNNYLNEKTAFFSSDDGNPEVLFTLDKASFDAKIQETKSSFESMKAGKAIDSLVLEMDSRNEEMYFKYLESNYESKHELAVKFAKGSPSPKFVNYENYKGGTNSLDDYKGKYVYLDIWATWCGPCKAEIPFLKDLEKDFHGRNVEFISISVDKPQAYEKWRQMVEDESLTGVQLYADNNFESEFIRAYGINAIPRFILLDPDGNIVSANAIRPSNPTIRDYFNELGI